MQLSGLVLDFYDDPQGLRDCWPDLASVPETVKTAHLLTKDEYRQLPDDVFALVLIEGGHPLRKYACVDPGNTEMNCQLFLKHASRLPEEARKVAAQNLIQACGWYGLEPSPELQKEALGLMGAANLALVGPSVVRGTHQSIRQNMAGVRALEGNGAVVPPTLMKAGEVSGTYDAPLQPPGDLGREVAVKKNLPFNRVAEKTAGVGNLVKTTLKGDPRKVGDDNEAATLTEHQYNQAPQFKSLRPHVDVTGRTAQRGTAEKKASLHAMGGRYPLDSYQDVKTASQYYEEWRKIMPYQDRHEYAVNLVKRASALGIWVSEAARRDGAESYAPAGEIKVAFDARRLYMEEGPARDMLEGLWEQRPLVAPDVFCEALGQIDKIAMLDCRYGEMIPDPCATTYGFEKKAEDDVWLSGNDYVTREQIENFGLTGVSTLEGSYGSEFANEFRKDPWGIFQSLPLLQKRRLVRMATDNSPTGKQHVG
jgi:hypothetical protein